MKNPSDGLKEKARRLGLHGIVANWEEVEGSSWLEKVVELEESERQRRSLESRIQNARIGRFKSMVDFDWSWPRKIDREAFEDLFRFQFIEEKANVVLVGSNGLGKTMIAQNLAYQALLKGYTVRFATASALLNELAVQESAAALQRRLRTLCRPQFLVIDEVGYLAYDNRHADLLFEVVSRRYQEKSILVTTNKAFSEWNQVFPNAGCVVTLIDRLIHRSEILDIDGESYRKKEAMERAAQKKKERSVKRKSGG